jgi:hypothetical protein
MNWSIGPWIDISFCTLRWNSFVCFLSDFTLFYIVRVSDSRPVKQYDMLMFAPAIIECKLNIFEIITTPNTPFYLGSGLGIIC